MTTHWYEEYAAVYRDELHTLKHMLPFFSLQQQLPYEQTGGLIVILGTLKLSANRKQLVRIVFPVGYPFCPPAIIPLMKVELPINGVRREQIAVMRFKSNQYSNNQQPLFDGKICLFDDEVAWRPFEDGVATALQQAIAWLEGSMTPAGLSKEQVVKENIPLLPHTGHILYYGCDEFPVGNAGRLLVKQFKENHYSLLQIQFENPPEPVKSMDLFPDNTVLSPTTKHLISGRWYKIDKPGNSVLPNLLNADFFQKFLLKECKVMINDLAIEPVASPKETIVAFRFSDSNLLHVFQLYYWKEGVTIKFNLSYLLPKDLNKELFSRIDPLVDLELLQSKKVFVVGAGAIGSASTIELAGSAIGNYVLIDEQPYDAGNTVRHAADLQFLGDSKVHAVKKLIEARNPKARVLPLVTSIFDIPLDILDHLLNGTDLVLDFTANPLVEKYLHHHCFIKRKLPVLQAAVSRGGLTGNVIVMSPGQSACLDCLKEKSFDAVPHPLVDTDKLKDTEPDLGTCSKPAAPGNGIDTREVALQAARVALQFLLRSKQVFYPMLTGYQYYWHGPVGAKSVVTGNNQPPFDWEICSYPGNSSCLYCKRENDQEINTTTISEARFAESDQPVS